MQAQDYATLTVAVMTIVGGFATGVRWLVKHYLNELKPNGGSSVKDSVIRLEEKVEILYQMMLQKGKNE
jgi:H+/Cl- antiporter ClcA